jgi:hypothetical protein
MRNIMFGREYCFQAAFIQCIPTPAFSKPLRAAQKFLLLALLSFLLVTPASANTYTVTPPGGGGTYSTMQACATAMSSSGGDTCKVFVGTYNEVVTLTPGTTGNYNVFTVNPGDTVNVYGFVMASHTKLNGFNITNQSTPYGNACVSVPAGTTDAYITNNSMQACGASGGTEQASLVGVRSGSTGATFIYVSGNTITHGCSTTTPPVNDVCENISIGGGDHWLIENNDLSHNDDTIEFYASYIVARNNKIHDITPGVECNPSSHGSNCHADQFESEPVVTAGTAPSTHNMFEGNTVKNALNTSGGEVHGILMQGDFCSGGCSHTIVRFNLYYNLQGYYMLNDIAPTGTSFPNVKSYNETLASGGAGDLIGNWHAGTATAALKNTIIYNNSCGSCTSGSYTYNLSTLANNLFNPSTSPFVDATSDWHLASGSAAIGAGGPLTTAVCASNPCGGTAFKVADPYYFQDGWGFPSGTGVGQMNPDTIRIGSSTTVQIAVGGIPDYTTGNITLATSATWNNGDPVYLYKNSTGTQVLFGSAPDIGAVPFSGSGGCATPQDSNTGTSSPQPMPVGEYTSSKYMSMPFTAGSSYTLCGVTLRMAKVLNPPNMTAYVYTDNSGVPGTLLGTGSASFNSSTLSSSEGDAAFVSLTASLTAGTQYWIVVELSSVDNNDFTDWYYTGGSASNVFQSSADGSTLWQTQNSYVIGKFTTFSP